MRRSIHPAVIFALGALFALILLAGYTVYAWSPPPYGGTCTTPPCPPNGNVPPPINTSASGQVKSGDFALFSSSSPFPRLGIGTNSPSATYALDVYKAGWKGYFHGTDGGISIGPANSGYSHIYTDNNTTQPFIFNTILWSYSGDGTGTGPAGLSSYSAQDLALQTNGTTRILVKNATGNVGIGTVSPTSRAQIDGGDLRFGTADRGLIFYGGGEKILGTAGFGIDFQTANGTSRLLIQNGGNVGISTASPGARLDVTSPDNTQTTQIATFAANNRTQGISMYWDGIGQFAATQLTFKVGGTERMRIDSSGNVGIGTASPTAKLDVYGDIASDGSNMWLFHTPDDGRTTLYFGRGANGVVSSWPFTFDANGTLTAGAFVYSSDARLKKNVTPIVGALQKVQQLQGVRFEWLADDAAKGAQIGFIAQDVEQIVPEIVTTDASNTMKAVDYAKVTALLVEAIKEQQQQIADLKSQIEELQR